MNMSNYLDFRDVLIYELIGDVWLTLIIGLFALWLIVFKKGLPNYVGILLSIIWIGIMFATAASETMIMWIILVIFIGAFTWYQIAKALGRT